MHSFITFNQTQSQELSELNLTQPHPDLFTLTSEMSLGIEQIRDLKQVLSLPPYQGEVKIIYLPQAEKLTVPAQNALLKSLEEPPPQVRFILQTTQVDLLLPTIQSRCQIINTKAGIAYQNNPKFDARTQPINQLTSQLPNQLTSLSSRLSLATPYTKKETALQLVKELTQHFRQQLLQHPEGQASLNNLRLLHQTKIYLDANTNVGLTIKNLFLHLKPAVN